MDHIKVLGQHGVRAVGHAILLDITRFHVRCNDGEVASAAAFSTRGTSSGVFPTRSRIALPRGFAWRDGRCREMQQARLRACIDVHFENVVVLPGDVQARGHADDVDGSVSLAGVARRFIFGGIPGIGGGASGRIQRDAGIVALGGRHHAIAPVFGHQRNPVAGKIDRSRGFGRCRSLSRAPLREGVRRHNQARGAGQHEGRALQIRFHGIHI